MPSSTGRRTSGAPRPKFWGIGHRLRKSTPEAFPVKFLTGDVPDPAHPHVPPGAEAVSVRSLTSLAPLRVQLSAILAYAVSPILSEDDQRRLAVKAELKELPPDVTGFQPTTDLPC